METQDPRYQPGWRPPDGEDYDNWEHMKICDPSFAAMFGDISADEFWEMTNGLFSAVAKYMAERKSPKAGSSK